MLDVFMAESGTHDSHAADITLEHIANRVVRARRVVFGIAEESIKTLSPGSRLKSDNDLGEEWIGNFRDDQSEEVRLLHGKSPRVCVCVIVEFANSLEHTALSLGCGIAGFIQDMRYRGERNARTLRDILHRVSHRSPPKASL